MLWGIIGMLLATPLTAIMKIIFERIELTAPVAELLAGRLDALRAE
jgi:AI-2 transport protein TqsA